MMYAHASLHHSLPDMVLLRKPLSGLANRRFTAGTLDGVGLKLSKKDKKQLTKGAY